ncbi:SURP domain-containing protein [Plasmodium brasilianum]|uniref:SURP motif domain-containing protein n=2 Tax=Plasmodium (Plasmodium) TaxID=418103 RepID=A0A1D3SMU3_PLAMA|nr:conserved Plasmodium protein, unknown function [Plasmodium malariae]KAI4837261.1 SURP domain-containing protein [Plasmodium brasilianum]SCO93143.1 conserved Plasmodium protein, unknown function [Plasmodium malariae]
MSKDCFNNEPPPDILNYLNHNETTKENYGLCYDKNEKEIFTSYLSDIKKNICLPKSLREQLIIEYTAVFANLESDIAEFYLKLDNELLIKFPFLLVDHPLHEYYQFVKLNAKERIIEKYPYFIPKPLRELFEYVHKLEITKIAKNETKTKMLKEKQKINIKDGNEKTKKQKEKQKEKEKEDQSYSTLFMKYMQSDEESDEKKRDEEAIRGEEISEVDDVLDKISSTKSESSILSMRLFIKCIEKLKYLQYGSKEYEYFSKKVLGNKNVSDSDLINVTSTDFLKLILTLDEQKITSCDIAPDIRGDENNSEDKDEFKMIQDYRRERAKMILHGFKKK